MQRLHWTVRVGALIALFGLAVGVSKARPESAPALQQQFTEQIVVRALNLEAVVTDRDGMRVPSLAASDFELYIDDQRVPIEHFSEVREGAAVGADTALPELTAGEQVPVNILLFIDEFFPIDRDKSKVLNVLMGRVENMTANDRVAVAAWNGEEVALLTSWTSSRAEVEQALAAADERPGQGLRRESERRQWDIGTRAQYESFARGLNTGDRYRLGGQERQYTLLYAGQLRAAVSAAVSAMRGLGEQRGRNVAVVLSGGWPWDPAQWVSQSQNRTITEPGIPRGAELYGPLSDTANLLGYTIYAVDLPGMQQGRDIGTAGFTPGSQFFLEGEMHNSLHYVSHETGGLAMINGQRVEAWDEVKGDMEAYYWLSVTPEWAADDERHEVRIEVGRDDLMVRHRQAYMDLSKQTQIAMAVQSSLIFAGERQPDFDAELGPFQKESRKEVSVQLKIRIPGDQLEGVQTDEGYVMQAVLFVAALDEDGGQSQAQPIPVVFTASRRPTASVNLAYETTIKLRRKRQTLALAVYDVVGDKTLTNVMQVIP